MAKRKDPAATARRGRERKAQALRSLQVGRTTLPETLLRPPTPLLRTDLHTVLLACPRLGRQGARRLCEQARVWPLTPMGELSRVELQALYECLPAKFKS